MDSRYGDTGYELGNAYKSGLENIGQDVKHVADKVGYGMYNNLFRPALNVGRGFTGDGMLPAVDATTDPYYAQQKVSALPAKAAASSTPVTKPTQASALPSATTSAPTASTLAASPTPTTPRQSPATSSEAMFAAQNKDRALYDAGVGGDIESQRRFGQNEVDVINAGIRSRTASSANPYQPTELSRSAIDKTVDSNGRAVYTARPKQLAPTDEVALTAQEDARTKSAAQQRSQTAYAMMPMDKRAEFLENQRKADVAGSTLASESANRDANTKAQTAHADALTHQINVLSKSEEGKQKLYDYRDEALRKYATLGDSEYMNVDGKPVEIPNRQKVAVKSYLEQLNAAINPNLAVAQAKSEGALDLARENNSPVVKRATGGVIPSPTPYGQPLTAPQVHPLVAQYGQYLADARGAGVQPLPAQKFFDLMAAAGGGMAGGQAQGFASGGAIPVAGKLLDGAGTGTSDSLPAVIDGSAPAALSAGEFVIPAHIVRAKGTEYFEKLLEQYAHKAPKE